MAEAQRIAADIRRRAEREANAIRRDAAEWASATRLEAERYRDRVLADLEHARAVAEPEDHPRGDERDEDNGPSPVIDLRSQDQAQKVRLVVVPPAEEGSEAGEEVVEVAHRPAVGGTYVVGHRLPVSGTSIETKVHDVVRLAVRRTFDRRFP